VLVSDIGLGMSDVGTTS